MINFDKLARCTFALIGKTEEKCSGLQISFAALGVAMYIQSCLSFS